LCKLTYNGPDTKAVAMLLPQERLGSNPMRLSKIDRHSNSTTEDEPKDTVIPGFFEYDESSQLAVMPVGACDIQCRQGLRKPGAVPMRFFCAAASEVSFTARADGQARFAMAWLDEEPVRTWHLKRSEGDGLLQLDVGSSARRSDGQQQQHRAMAADTTSLEQAVLLSMGLASRGGGSTDFDIVRSGPSPVFKVLPGEHTLYVQGRVDDHEGFALQGVRFDSGVEHCTWFLEGQDKTYNDCR
jgi:hypothetical protein